MRWQSKPKTKPKTSKNNFTNNFIMDKSGCLGIIVPFQMNFYVVLLTLVGFLKLWLFYNSLNIPKITNNKMYFQSRIGWKVHK